MKKIICARAECKIYESLAGNGNFKTEGFLKKKISYGKSILCYIWFFLSDTVFPFKYFFL